MSKKLSAADPREVERAARDVPGVAFAEVVDEDNRPVLRVVLWQGVPSEDTAAMVEIALRDALGVEIHGGDIRFAGVANAPAGQHPGDVRVIDLGGNTWATEPIDPPVPSLGAAASHRTPTILSVTVSRGVHRCSARVEVETITGVRTAETSAPSTEDKMLAVVAEAAAHASAAAYEIPLPAVEDTRIDRCGRPLAIVVVCAPGADPRRAAGAALVGDDTFAAIAAAALHAVASLVR